MLCSPSDCIDSGFKSWFPYPRFNKVQSECINVVLRTDKNVVISAPTGSGKTVVFEFAMIRCFKENKNAKAIYLGPTRSLCGERARDWNQKLGSNGLKVIEFTGDTDHQFIPMDVNLIVATPEKLDSITRQKQVDFLKDVKLLMIDEVHMLNEQRGATIEVVVGRFKRKLPQTRFVAVSATIPNSNDICKWLSNFDSEAENLRFGQEARPVPMEQHIICSPVNGRNGYVYENSLTYQLPNIIQQYSDQKSVLIFCSTRKSVQITAEYLANQSISLSSGAVQSCDDAKLTDLLKKGVGVHHAGLSSKDRRTVEQSFLSGKIRILCSTSTLAVGVNLPAHLVIIKSTLMYNGRNYTEYTELEILQMIGRAGRPQFDTSAVVVIMTDPVNKSRYENLIAGMRPIESTLHLNLAEHLNSEIATGGIRDIEEALDWLTKSYLYIRLLTNPEFYECHEDQMNFLKNLCEGILNRLDKMNLITISAGKYSVTKLGTSMSRTYCKIETMEAISEMKRNPNLKEILETVCKAGEYNELRYQPGDKTIINDLLKDFKIKYKDGEKLKFVWQRVFYLVQATLADIQIPKYGYQQLQEIQWIFSRSKRIIKCIIEYLSEKKDGIGLMNALELQSILNGQAWSDSHKTLTQVPKLGKAYANTLNASKIRSISDLRTCEARKIEVILGRNPPFGNQVKESINQLPCLYVNAYKHDQKKSEFTLEYGAKCSSNATFHYNLLVLAFRNELKADIVEHKKFSYKVIILDLQESQRI